MSTTVVLATSNQGKLNEMQGHLRALDFEVKPQSAFAFDEAIEDGLTFVKMR